MARIGQLILVTFMLASVGRGWAQSATGGTAYSLPLTDTTGLAVHNAKAETVEYLGRRAVRLTVPGVDGAGLAVLRGTEFQDGVIEAEIALKSLAPKGVRFPGFVGIAFRAAADDSKYELFYLRPGNSHSEDQGMRNHSVQYASEPDYDWYPLRRNWPWVYESHAELAFESWTKMRIEVAGRMAKLYVNGEESPSLIVDGLKGSGLSGGVALWAYSGEEAYFSNVRVTASTPEPIKNGTDASGEWSVRLSTDYGGFPGTMKLNRDGGKVSGSWSGAFGEGLPITGTWRDGYVELSFPGNWTAETPDGKPGPVTVNLAGWLDGNAAKGRARVLNRADGQWSAERKP